LSSFFELKPLKYIFISIPLHFAQFSLILAPFWLHFGSIIAPFWLHYCSILAPLLLHFCSNFAHFSFISTHFRSFLLHFAPFSLIFLSFSVHFRSFSVIFGLIYSLRNPAAAKNPALWSAVALQQHLVFGTRARKPGVPAGVKRIMERAGGCVIRSFEVFLHIKRAKNGPFWTILHIKVMIFI
jgi:hypothetical protein